MHTGSSASLAWHACMTDRHFVPRLMRAQYRHGLSFPAVWLVGLGLGGLVALAFSQPDGPRAAVGIILAGIVGLLVYGYVRTVRLLPVGTVLHAALGPHHLHVRNPLVGQNEIRYTSFRRVVVRGELVILEPRVGRGISVLPLALLPEPLLGELRERIRAAEVEQPPSAPVPQTRPMTSYTTDVGYVRRLARTVMRQMVLILVVAVAIAIVVFSALQGADVSTAASAVPFMAVVVTVVSGLMYRSVRRRLAAQVPVGSVFRAGADEEHLWLESPVASMELDYSMITRIRTRGEFVFLRHRSSQEWLAFPVQVFPGEAVSLLRERVAAASARAGSAG